MLAAAVALLLLGCGGGDDVAAVSTPSPTPTPTPADADGDDVASPTAEPAAALTERPGGGSGGLTAAPPPVATPDTPAEPKPTPPAEAAPTTAPEACPILDRVLGSAFPGRFPPGSGSEADTCFVFHEEPAILLLYPAADFASQVEADREADGVPLEGVGDQAVYFSDMQDGTADAVLVQSGDHAFLLLVAGLGREDLLAAAQAVIDQLG